MTWQQSGTQPSKPCVAKNLKVLCRMAPYGLRLLDAPPGGWRPRFLSWRLGGLGCSCSCQSLSISLSSHVSHHQSRHQRHAPAVPFLKVSALHQYKFCIVRLPQFLLSISSYPYLGHTSLRGHEKAISSGMPQISCRRLSTNPNASRASLRLLLRHGPCSLSLQDPHSFQSGVDDFVLQLFCFSLVDFCTFSSSALPPETSCPGLHRSRSCDASAILGPTSPYPARSVGMSSWFMAMDNVRTL